MRVAVRLQGHLKHFHRDGRDRFPADLPDGATVRELITATGIPWEEVGLVAVGGRQVDESCALTDGDGNQQDSPLPWRNFAMVSVRRAK